MEYESHPIFREVHVGAMKKMIVMYSTKLATIIDDVIDVWIIHDWSDVTVSQKGFK